MSVTILGVICIILGILAMMAPTLTGLSIAMALGVLIIAGGILRIIWAFRAESLGRGLLRFAVGGLTLLCGIALIAHPLFAAGLLTIVLAAYFILDGISEIAAGIQRQGAGSGWLLFGGIISLLLGIMIWAQYPLSGAWAMGILVGIKLFLIGVIMLTAGSALRQNA
jgi:uncharacterized membrane protein HdeD (DUF308 family)